MVKVNFGEVDEVLKEMMKLGSLGITEPKLRHWVKRDIARLRKSIKLREECAKDIKTKYGTLDREKNKFNYATPEKEELCGKELEDLYKKEIEENLFELEQSLLDKVPDLKASCEGVLDYYGLIIETPKPEKDTPDEPEEKK